MEFVLQSPFKPTGDQPSAIRQLLESINLKGEIKSLNLNQVV